MKKMVLDKFGLGAFFILLAAIMLIANVIPNTCRLMVRTFSGDYQKTTAVITEIQEEKITETRVNHTVFVLYTADGNSHMTALDTYAEGMQVGDEIEIYYHTGDHDKITLSWNQPMQILLFGALSLIFGLIGIILIRKKTKCSHAAC